MDAVELLLGRDSALKLTEPAPSEKKLDIMLCSAMRAPDHGRLRPWHFAIVRADKREAFGEVTADVLRRRRSDATSEMLQRERDKAMRAPLIVVAAARIDRDRKIPPIEQIASAAPLPHRTSCLPPMPRATEPCGRQVHPFTMQASSGRWASWHMMRSLVFSILAHASISRRKRPRPRYKTMCPLGWGEAINVAIHLSPSEWTARWRKQHRRRISRSPIFRR
jgi:nitroreductase